MMTTPTPTSLPQSFFRWLTHCLLSCSLVAAHASMATAHDFEAVAKRLAESVKHGEITKDQARAMMAALSKSSEDRERADKAPGGGDQSIAEQLKAAVKAGKLTEEQATAKWNALTKQHGDAKHGDAQKGDSKHSDAKHSDAKHSDAKHSDAKHGDAKKGEGLPDAKREAIAEQLKAAVKAGKLTEEQAIAKWVALTKDFHAKHRDAKHRDAKHREGLSKAKLEALAEQLKAAVKAGKLTEVQAKAKWEALTRDFGAAP